MSNKKRPSRKDFARLERQFDQLFASVETLVSVMRAQIDASAAIPDIITNKLAGTVAAAERDAAERMGARVNH